MRPFGATTIKDATANGIGYNTQSTVSRLVEIWNLWEIQLMVLTSFVLQLFLFVTGNLRRRNICSPLRVSIWLAYIGADLVAVYALGLFSQYEEKYILGRHSFRDTSPFLWVPFLLVHLGGQDYITAFSIEDNNLWLRHLLNLGIQGSLALYVFWKSIHRMNSQVLFPAPFIFVSGIIKYGERTWALRTGSRDGLGKSSLKPAATAQEEIHAKDGDLCISSSSRARASYALQTVLLAQGLFVGRTMHQLGNEAKAKFEKYFMTDEVAVEEKVKIKVLVMELGMMFDLLYTKAMVLQRRTGRIFRCAAQVSMVAAFVLFVVQDHHARKHISSSRVDTGITYTLFIGAILMEACSVAMVIASPWTKAHLDDTRTFLGWLYSSSSKAFSRVTNAIVRCKHQRPSSYSIGQFNYIDFVISHGSTPSIICKVISALGLGRQWRNLWYLKRVEAQGIVEYVVRWFDRSPVDYFSRRPQLGRRLNYTLCLPFEHALYRLHIYTDLYISEHFDVPGRRSTSHAADVMLLKKDCEKLSNYMAYLKEAYPSMLPISSVVNDGTLYNEEKKENPDRLSIVGEHAKKLFNRLEPLSASPFEPDSASPFEPADLKQSLEEIREMWMRLLVYAAGKCSGELHARHLSKGCELLTFVWLLMLHHGLGDAATQVNLLTSDDPNIAEPGSVVASEGSNFAPRPEQPRYAFNFCCRQRQMRPQEQHLARMHMRHYYQIMVFNGSFVQRMLSGNDETEQDGGAPEQNERLVARRQRHPRRRRRYTEEQGVLMHGAN